MWFLGIDTSNYTTSVAVYHSQTHEVRMRKKLLPVKDAACGLRQSDAVFLHVKQLAGLVEQLMAEEQIPLTAIGVSATPRNAEGSYMPCFLVGTMVAQVLSSVLRIPLYTFSHQQGHIAAALYSADCLDYLHRDFYAFHVSGGTTEALGVHADGEHMDITLLAQTLDLNAGQAVDRVGVMLGLPFPCGQPLEQLALACTERVKGRAKLKGADCCLSGLQNQCETLYRQGKSKEYVARFCLESIKNTIAAMTEALLREYGNKPIVYAGGVMSNSIIRAELERRFHGKFAAPTYSTDNSAGIALLASIAHGQSESGKNT